MNPNNSTLNSGKQNNYSMAAGWGYRSDKINWDATVYDRETHSQTFEVIDTGQPAHVIQNRVGV